MRETVFHQMLMLKPMRAGIGGYARLQGEAGRQLVQIHLRGLEGGSIRAFWYAGEGLVRELGSSSVNPKGEAGLYTELADEGTSPRRLTALLITDGQEKPLPLAIGLCAAQSAGSLLDARNALLALCERLGREAAQQEACRDAGGGTAVSPGGAAVPGSGAAVSPGGAAVSPGGAAVPGGMAVPGGGMAVPGGGTAVPGGGAAVHGSGAAVSLGGTAVSPGGGAAVPGEMAVPGSGAAVSPGGAAGETPRSERRCRTDGSGKAAAGQVPREVFLPAIDVLRERRRSRRETAQEEPAAPQGAALPPREAHAGGGSPDPGKHPCGKEAENPRAGGQNRSDPARATDGRTPHLPLSDGKPTAPVPPRRAQGAPPADRLPALRWPEPFGQVGAYFHRLPPLGLPEWPGWRFVEVKPGAEGLRIGVLRSGRRVEQVAYVLPDGAPLPPGRPFRRIRTADGTSLQILVMKA